MRIELTEQSGLEVNRLSAADMTPAMAARYLEGRIRLRGFWETLRSLYHAGDLRDRVSEALYRPGDDPKSVARRVRNWEQGKNAPTGRTCSALPSAWNWMRSRPLFCWECVRIMASTTETAES